MRQGKNIKKRLTKRLNIAQINKNDFYNSKGEKIDYCEITPEYFIENDIENYFFIVKKI
ncbi:MAG: hypothetical protein Q9M97_06055 [Candidatus Gracilibacteria bacterium]|nr:hypothetical protein [Candidatus Gracilibacteria bacterium]